MTRDEFMERIDGFYELTDFCSEYGCYYCDDIYDDDAFDEEVEYDIKEYHDDYSWRDIRDILCDLPTGYSFYRKDGVFSWSALDDDDFEALKDEVYEWAEDNNIFDEEDEDDEDFCDEDDVFIADVQPAEKEEPIEDEDFPIDDLMSMSVDMLVVIRCADEERKKEADMEFNDFVSRNMPKVLA